jgi:hypothetical protein
VRASVRAHADKLAARHGRDPWMIADALGVPIIRERLPGRLTEIYISEPGPQGAVGLVIDQASSPDEARQRIAHGLAHHLLHTGNRLTDDLGRIWSGGHEQQADDFAAYLLISGDELRQGAGAIDAPTEWDLAQRFGVSADLIRRRATLMKLDLTQSVP